MKFHWHKLNIFLAIPPTLIDNELVLSLAGKIASPSRSSISTENIENIVSIARNYPNVTSIDSKRTASATSLEDFSDYLLKEEIILGKKELSE